MNAHSDESERRRNAITIGMSENKGGLLDHGSADHQFGRRIEADRSWTVYHVFTGVPAQIAGEDMVGLSRSDATSNMLSLNLRKHRAPGGSGYAAVPCHE